MPEYLAPGVYVEETSFRSRSIEGVSTTTTAFIGPTLKGPYGSTPQLLTSFADFARIYGGLDDIGGTTNYLAHAVRAFFDNGGSRLYVARVVPVDNQKNPALPPSSFARSQDLFVDDPDNIQVQFVARFPGEGGNGEVEIFQQATPVSQHLLNGAPVGSILRVKTGENLHAQPARAEGGNEPFFIPDGGQLRLTIGTNDRTITFRGRPAEVVSTETVPETMNLPAASKPAITVQIGNGPSQSISLPTGNGVTRAAIVTTINQNLRGGYAWLTDTNALAIGTDVRGLAARIQVSSSQGLSITFPANPVESNNAAENNVRDLGAVTIADIVQILSTANIGLEARSSGNGNQRLVLQTTATGENARFQVRTGDNSVHSILGLTAGNPHVGISGATSNYFAKTDSVERTVTEPQYSAWKNLAGESLSQNDFTPSSNREVSLITLAVIARDSNGTEIIYEGLGLSPSHPRWIGHVLSESPKNSTEALNNPFAIKLSDTSAPALTLYNSLAPQDNKKSRLVPVRLAENADLGSLSVQAYEAALDTLLPLEEISIVAAPGYSAYYAGDENKKTLALGIQDKLKTFVERRRSYQIAVLDSPPKADFTTIRTLRSQMDSEYAALYYPWVTIANPLASPARADIPSQIDLPPSGFICGIYARNDIQRGVYKAPANEVIRGALGLETNINFDQQGALNPQGINCLRFFPGRGYRVWGARLATSNSEVKYVSDRRYLNYLERSIDQGTQFAVFEPNGPKLWTNIRDTISGFLYNEWFSGALLGTTPQESFFVRCDRSTMTQNDLDNGRLICLVGVALQKPAEFVIFRIGQAVLSGSS